MNELSELERLREENDALKLVVGSFSSRFQKYFDADKTDDKPKEETRDTRYDALLEELEFNDKMAGKETTKEVPNKVPPMYQKLLSELRENDELLNNTIK